MTLIDDEDLPVLTQVLRTGDGRLPATGSAEALASDSRQAGADDNDDDGEPPWSRALVIGSDPERPDDEPADVWRDASTIRRAASPNADTPNARADGSTGVPGVMTSPSRDVDLGSRDAFLNSAPPDTAFDERIDEPPLLDHRRLMGYLESPIEDAASSPSFALSRDVALAFDRPSTSTHDDDAGFALRVRDSVLRELSARIDTELDARIAQTLHAALETALGQLQGSLRVELAEALRDVVGRAVDDAVARLQDTQRPDDGR